MTANGWVKAAPPAPADVPMDAVPTTVAPPPGLDG